MTFGAKHRWRRAGAYLAVTAVLLQVSFGVMHSFAFAASLLAPDTGKGVSATMVICTPTGLKTIRLGDDERNVPDPHSPEENCPTCLHFTNCGALVPEGASHVLRVATCCLTPRRFSDQWVGADPDALSSVRGPPVIS